MTDDELDAQLFGAFLLGLQCIFESYDITVAGVDDHKHWNLLREIAAGSTTLAGNPAEMLRKYPNVSQEIRDRLANNVNRVVQEQRELAIRILRGFPKVHGEE